jgi:hypothetical protein
MTEQVTLLQVKTTGENFNKAALIKGLNLIAKPVEVYSATGEFDYIVKYNIDSNKLTDVKEKIFEFKKLPFVANTETTLLWNEIV